MEDRPGPNHIFPISQYLPYWRYNVNQKIPIWLYADEKQVNLGQASAVLFLCLPRNWRAQG
jgi:hypothetical protein